MKENRHYICVDAQDRITDGWSDGVFPARDASGAILLREDGGYQFRLFPGGEENPTLTDETGAHLWRYGNGQVRESAGEELEAERQELEAARPPVPVPLESRVEAVETGKADKEEIQAVWNSMATAYAEGVKQA